MESDVESNYGYLENDAIEFQIQNTNDSVNEIHFDEIWLLSEKCDGTRLLVEVHMERYQVNLIVLENLDENNCFLVAENLFMILISHFLRYGDDPC